MIPRLAPISTKATPTELKQAFEKLRTWFAYVEQSGGFITGSNLGSSVNTVANEITLEIPVDSSVPPVVTGFTVTGAFNSIILEWNTPSYGNHAYTEVWRAETDDLGVAVLVGSTTAAIYADLVPDSSLSVDYYYWVRNVSTSAINGPFNAVSGTIGSTADDPAYVLEILLGKLGYGQFDIAGGVFPITTVTSLPTLPNATYPVGVHVYLTTNGKLYRNVSNTWTASVATSDLSGQITTTQITNNAVTSDKIIANAVTAGKIATGAIVAGDGVISNAAIANAMIIDATITSAKILSLAADKITTGYLAAARIQTGSLSGDKITTNSLTALQIAANTITATQMAADSITTNELAANSVTTANIVTGNITTDTINGNAVTEIPTVYAEGLTFISTTASTKATLAIDNKNSAPVVFIFSWETQESSARDPYTVYIRRGGTTIHSREFKYIGSGEFQNEYMAFTDTDAVTGAQTYTVVFETTTGTLNTEMYKRNFTAFLGKDSY